MNTGYTVELDKELNGLSLAGIGSGTTIENIAVLGGSDDGIELWGGTVNLTNVFVKGAADDSLDWDQGYNGTITNIYLEQTGVDGDGSRGIEGDGKGKDDNAFDQGAAFVSNPTVSKLTIKTVEAGGAGMRLREGTGGQFDNVVVYSNSSTKDGIRVTDAVSLNDKDDNLKPKFENTTVIIADQDKAIAGDGSSAETGKTTDSEVKSAVWDY
jgi:hypothetical protein